MIERPKRRNKCTNIERTIAGDAKHIGFHDFSGMMDMHREYEDEANAIVCFSTWVGHVNLQFSLVDK